MSEQENRLKYTLWWKGRKDGPYTISELREMLDSGQISPVHLVEDAGERTPLRDFLTSRTRLKVKASATSSQVATPSGPDPSFDHSQLPLADEDAIRKLDDPYLPAESLGDEARPAARFSFRDTTIAPLLSFFTFSWLGETLVRILLIAVLPPIAVIALEALGPTLQFAHWFNALYFSAVWFVFFTLIFKPDSVQIIQGVIAFVTTVLFSMVFLFNLLKQLPGIEQLEAIFMDPTREWADRYGAVFLSVSLIEEVVKVAAVIAISAYGGWRMGPRAALFIGLVSGLGFGIHEGVSYQLGFNRPILAEGQVQIYEILTILRLTSLPLNHAIWTGIAGYFVGLAALQPDLRWRLILLGLIIAAALHSGHNTTTGLIQVSVAVLGVVFLLSYARTSTRIPEPSPTHGS